MFVKNRTPHKIALSRGRLLDDLAIATVVWRATYRVEAGGLVPWEGERSPLPTDPPETIDHPLWHGTSVTVAGPLEGREKPPFATRLDLLVGEEKRSLLVFGERRWIRNAGRLVPSVPLSWETLPMSWALAFGGGYDLPPAPHPVSKLPHPGGRVDHPQNPSGVGFYPSETAAEGALLPAIEALGERLETWNQWVQPACFAPCPDSPSLRLSSCLAPDDLPKDNVAAHIKLALQMAHPAPAPLIFPWIAPGTPVEFRDGQKPPIGFAVPPSPFRLDWGKKNDPNESPPRVRAVFLSLEDGAVLVDHAHPFLYHPKTPPLWVGVEAR